MNPRPYRPAAELEAAIDRGDLDLAVELAREVAEDRGQPVDLATALRLLPLVAAQRAGSYDSWACRWLARWLTETGGATIDQAVDLAAGLAALPVEPEAIQAIAQVSSGSL
jgi:hypothetical protein